jgi:hypothetical protein
MVLLGSSCRETAKNAIKNNRWENTTGKKFFFLNFFRPKVFDMYFPKKVFNGVFELPLLRNSQKRHKKNSKKKKRGTYLPHLVAICQIYGGFNFFFFGAPRNTRASRLGPRVLGLGLPQASRLKKARGKGRQEKKKPKKT